MVKMTGRVVDSLTQEPLAALVTFRMLPAGDNVGIIHNNSRSGEYDLSLVKSKRYDFKVRCADYWPRKAKITAQDDMTARNFALKPIAAVGETMPLENLLFNENEYEILPDSYEELGLLMDIMDDNPRLKVRLEGHTDVRGAPKSNLDLSKNRVKAVKQYLVERGVDDDRIETKGFGANQPKVNRSDPSNRRVEVRVLAK